MARCQSCSAPLLANTNRCQYCNVRNDVDLNAKRNFSVTNTQQLSDRICPHCDKRLQTIQLELEQTITIERCNQCFGLFFDIGEIEALLEHSVSHADSINSTHIDNINSDRYDNTRVVRYIKCPVCQAFMRRTNFAKKSGVVVDSCEQHGFWLDSGEITHLMEWKKAGGQLLHEQYSDKSAVQVRVHQHAQPKKYFEKSAVKEKDHWHKQPESTWDISLSDGNDNQDSKELDVIDVLSYVIKKLF